MGEKITVTQEILDMNPCLVDQGVKIGEEIELGEACNEDGSALTGEPEINPPSVDDRQSKEANSTTDIIGGREKDDR